ncbi:MAG TPA: exo-alpha-sialidase [Lentimicrobium sp.]|nr:exo-alpha-sialidase [Lentimicrobium sp.]
MRILYLLLLILSVFQELYAQHTNITITNYNSPNEPSIFIDPKNPLRMMAANNINDYYTSEDGGYTWRWGDLESPLGVWGDPCIITDTAGNFYFFHLSNPLNGEWIDRIVCQRTNDMGVSWTPGSGIGHIPGKVQDKEWAVVNPANNEIYVTWTQFDEYGSENPNDSSIIRFSKSVNMGDTWSEAVRLSKVAGDCIDSDNTVEGAVPTVGPEGQIYVSWSGPVGIVFDRSTDGGNTWLDDDIFVTEQIGGWDQPIPGIYRCNGMPVTDCDRSDGPYRGTIYINYADQKNGMADTDIWLTKSTDGGNTWSEPVRVNDDQPGRQQFFPWMAVDQTTGKIWIVFYDRRNHSDLATDVYLAVSSDGGETFSNVKISEEPFIPLQTVFFGDYNNISATNDIVRPVWTRLHNGELSVMTAIVDPLVIGTHSQESEPFADTYITPNPFNHSTAFSFKLHKTSKVSLSVNDVTGRKIIDLINNQSMDQGKYTKILETEGYNLKPGAYFFILNVDNRLTTRKVIFLP